MVDDSAPVQGHPPDESPLTSVAVPAVVGIGASAGGLHALERFFATVPADSGLAYVVVVHLAPDRESHLAQLLQAHAAIRIRQVTATVPLEPDQAYVIPPGQNLSAIDSHLRLSPLESQRLGRAPVDHFFRTLAETNDGRAIGVVLSGTGADGAEGVRYIRERGGMVVVQDPLEAEYDGMPRSAINTGVADVVAPVAEILTHIVAFARTKPQLLPAGEAGQRHEERPDPLQRILSVVRLRTGQDFTRYKRSTVARRVSRRMQVLGVEQLSSYLDVLRDNSREATALQDDLLINVTGFFRDPAVFRVLEQDILPKLFEGKGPSGHVRVWSVGCSTGEEAFSVAMLLTEEARRRTSAPQIQVFASDLHERSLRFAREALYPASIEADVPAERLERFFHRDDGGYRVVKELRDSVVFAVHNLLQDPPFSRLDLIVCRNVLIYLQSEVQREVIELFHYALQGGGFLLLGTAESVDRPDLFRLENKECHLYQRRDGHRRELRLPVGGTHALPQFRTPMADGGPGGQARHAAQAGQSYGELHETMVERYAPPSLLVDRAHDVVHLSEHAGRYLQLPGGIPSTNVFKLVREELRVELRATIFATSERGQVTHSRPIPLQLDGEPRQVVLRVSPIAEAEHDGCFLVIFDELEPEAGLAPAAPGVPDTTARQLEAELEVTRGRLRTVLEEFESTQEEMRASNEELQSANEELRSTMEELETSREELQSMNEELQTVNQENKHKVEELSQLSNDLQNLLQATDVATVFLDRNFRILRFTPPVSDIFHIRYSDRGRPLADLTHGLVYGELMEDITRVLQLLVPAEREVESQDGKRSFVVRVTPYRTMEDRIEGVVITLVDVTALKQTAAAQHESEARFRAVANLVPDLLWEEAADGSRVWFNDRWYAYTGQSQAESAGIGWAAAIHPDDRGAAMASLQLAVSQGRAHEDEHRIRRADGEYRWFLARQEPVRGPGGAIVRWFGTATDVHEQRLALRVVERRVAERTEALSAANMALQQAVSMDGFRVRLADTLRAVEDPVAVRGAASRSLGEYLRATRVLFAEAAPDGIVVLPHAYQDGVKELRGPLPSGLPGAGVLSELTEGRPIVVEDVAHEPRLDQPAREAYRAIGVGAQVLVPRVEGGRLTALMAVQQVTPRTWPPAELALIEEAAARTWDALTRAGAESERNTLRRQLARAEEDERGRLARELHDQLGQHLTAFALGLEQVRRLVPNDAPTERRLAQLEELARSMMRDAGYLALELRPPELDDVGLANAVETYVNQWSTRYGVAAEVAASGLGGDRPAPEIGTTIYRIVQEALTNVARHAGAREVSVILERHDGMLRLVVEDDGRGFDPDKALKAPGVVAGFGLAGMHERAALIGGTLTIESSPNAGTSIYVEIPEKLP